MSIAIGHLSDFENRKPYTFDFEGDDVLVVRIDDEFFAVQDECTHGAVSLSEGEITDCAVECFLHGATFDLRTGVPQTPPAVTPLETFSITLGDEPNPTIYLAAKG